MAAPPLPQRRDVGSEVDVAEELGEAELLDGCEIARHGGVVFAETGKGISGTKAQDIEVEFYDISDGAANVGDGAAQTDISFPHHSWPCAIVDSAEDAIVLGLVNLAQRSLQHINDCAAHVGELLGPLEVVAALSDMGTSGSLFPFALDELDEAGWCDAAGKAKAQLQAFADAAARFVTKAALERTSGPDSSV